MKAEEQRQDRSTGELIAHASEDITTLIRTEIALAKKDLADTGKRAGIGAGAFGAAGALALYGLGALIAAAILGLAGPLAPWLSALIVAGSLFVVAGTIALFGKSRISKVASAPKERVESVHDDVAAVKGAQDGPAS